eukprot:m.159157 g.159157  ORF g.159157 m.159157 type:complete len:136 (-) comp53006_c0_seq3:1027-1434(-)
MRNDMLEECKQVVYKYGDGIITATNLRGDFGSSSPLHEAATEDRLYILEWFLLHVVNVDIFDSVGLTPLMYAASRGHTQCVEVLLDFGADARMTCSDGQTALEYAEEDEHDECADVLRGESKCDTLNAFIRLLLS